MAYLRKSQVTGLSPRGIDLNTITTPAGARINGDITSHTLKMADTFTVVDDITISDNLILAKVSDDGDDLILTSDNVSDRTIEGSGSIEGSTIAQTPNASLTGMTGELGSAVFPTGTVLNVVSATKSDIQQFGSTYTETEISDLICTITPKYTTSKIYISGHVSVGHTVATAWNYIVIFRGSTRIGQGPLDGAAQRGHSATDNRAYAMRSLPIHYMDSPGTTNAITYSIKHASGSAGARINKDGENAASNHATGVSTLTVMEIAG